MQIRIKGSLLDESDGRVTLELPIVPARLIGLNFEDLKIASEDGHERPLNNSEERLLDEALHELTKFMVAQAIASLID